ncbi:tRNA (guanosine(18)-2'-O)-methyltransferase [Trichomonascus vanleenenianus]|uniref:tRNA (guanosine(18)-2'-O)-methyltransferase n=1 Tax=Trichomonascus vanleenenianus TaxID=2268995 RepID=UPI003ECAE993
MSLEHLIGDIDESTRLGWASSIVDKVFASDDVAQSAVLAQLYNSRNDKDWTVILEKMKGKFAEFSERGKSSNAAIELCGSIPELRDSVLETTEQVFDEFMVSTNFIWAFRPLLESTEEYINELEEIALVSLDRLSSILSSLMEKNELQGVSNRLQRQLCLMQGAKNEAIASTAHQIVGSLFGKAKYLESVPDLIWSCITALLSESTSEVHYYIGYKLWLKWVEKLGDKLGEIKFFQRELLDSEEYWKYLQTGVASESYELKKYGLYILSRSVQLIDHNVCNKYIEWDITQREESLQYWQRYITLMEIISIDTSMHQAEDSAGDIVRMLSTDSAIPATWGVCLLSAGLNASMDSIRKFIANIIMMLPINYLSVFHHSHEFLSEVFFPHVMTASYFTVTEGNDGTYASPHSERLANFIKQLLHSMNEECAQVHIQNILVMLYKVRYSFDPARIYVIKGIRDALIEKSFDLSVDNLSNLANLGSTEAQSRLRQHCIVLLMTQILMSTEPVGDNVEAWLQTLNVYLSKNPKLLDIPQVSDHVCKRVAGCIDAVKSTNNLDVALKAELLIGLDETNWVDSLDFDEKCKVIVSEYKRSAQYLASKFDSVFIEQLTAQLYDKSWDYCSVAETIDAANPGLFQFRHLDTQYSQYKSAGGVDFEGLAIALRLSRLQYTATRQREIVDCVMPLLSGNVPAEMRPTRDRALEEVLRTLVKSINDSEKVDVGVSDVANLVSDHYATSSSRCRLAMCQCLLAIVDRAEIDEPKDFAELVEAMWDSLVDEKLVASQRKLHQTFMDVAFHVKAIESLDVELQAGLSQTAEKIIACCYARRALLPYLAWKLSHGPSNLWLGQLMLYIYTFEQIDDHFFKLEVVMGDMLDNCLSTNFGADISSYLEVYGMHEYQAKVHAITYISNMQAAQAELFEFVLTAPRYHIFNPIKRTDSSEEYVRIFCYQALLLLEPYVSDKQISGYTEQLFIPALDTEPSPLARVYIEWIIGRTLTLRAQHLITSFVFRQLEDSEAQPRIIASVERIGLMVGRSIKNHWSGTDPKRVCEYYRQYLERVIPLATSNRAAVRHFTVSILYAVHHEAASRSTSQALTAELADLFATVANIAENARAADSFKQFRSGEQTIWDLEADYTMVGVCGGVLRRLSDRNIPVLREHHFEGLASGRIPTGHEDAEVWATTAQNTVPGDKLTLEMNATAAQLQTKSGAWNLGTVDDQAETDKAAKIVRGELIVLASLVDKPPNLGGICRLCDVLGAQLMCVNELSIIKHAQFRNVAVTADKWMPMDEVRIEDIISFMEKKKREGYTLIGLEQTDNSVQLTPSVEFPRKSVLLLGKEREGIPANLLAELDFCIEIKQVGMIRSMNIQTATAVVVHAYSAQHC